MADFQRRYAPNWIGVAELILDSASSKSDEFLSVLGRHFGSLVETHYNGSEGCASCSGEIQHCGPWNDAQELMLAWLISKVDL
jgi:hypothetical protein